MIQLLITTIAAVLLVGCLGLPSENSLSLICASDRVNLQEFTLHLTASDNVNAAESNGHTPLHYAVEGGRNEIVEILI